MHKKFYNKALYTYFISLIFSTFTINASTIEQKGRIQKSEVKFTERQVPIIQEETLEGEQPIKQVRELKKKIGEEKKEESKKPFSFAFDGYVCAESYFDTRQNVSLRNGQFLLYPLPQMLDAAGNDINAHSSFTMVAIETRVSSTITGPNIWCAKTSAFVEGDFLGITDDTINAFRMRHAYIRWEWEKTLFIAGQYWHPITVLECFPDTISFNTGAPMEPQSRAPQLRVEYKFNDNLLLIACAAAQLDFDGTGPAGYALSYIRNSTMPNFHLQLQGNVDHKYIFGVGADLTRYVPRIVTNNNYAANESLSSWVAIAYAAFKPGNLTWSNKFTYGQNANAYSMLSGFGISNVDPVTNRQCYSNTTAWGIWTDIFYTHKGAQPGLFVGYTKNIGSSKPLFNFGTTATPQYTVYAEGPNIDYVMRVAPRFRWIVQPVTFGVEIEYTRAAYGTISQCGRVTNTTPVGNLRFLFAFFYSF